MKTTLFFSIGLSAVAAVLGLTAVIELVGLKKEQARVKREIADFRERAGRFERRMEDMRPPLGEAPRPSARMGAVSMERGPLSLSLAEIQLIRDYIKVPPGASAGSTEASVGDKAPDRGLLPLPPQIGEKYPRLKAARFTTDRAGGILIVLSRSERIDAIIAPQ